MPSRHLQHVLLLLSFVLAIEPAFAQPTQSDTEQLQARIDAAAEAHARDERYRGLSPKDRQGLAEFVSGNILFTLLHEAGHAAINELGLLGLVYIHLVQRTVATRLMMAAKHLSVFS